MKTTIIGGGLIGLCSAYALMARGEEVEILEAREDVGLETSFANGGFLSPSMPDPWNSPGVFKYMLTSFFDQDSAMKLRLKALPSLVGWGLQFIANSSLEKYRAASVANYHLCEYSLQNLRQWRDDLDLKFDSTDYGSMKIFDSEQAMQGPMQMAEYLKRYGLKSHVLNTEEAITVEPALAESQERIKGAIHYPGDGMGDSFLFCQEIAKQLRSRGVNIQTACNVQQIEALKDGSFELKVNNETKRSGRLLIAAGVYSPMLARRIGLRVPVRPAKGYSATIDVTGMDNIPKTAVVDDGMHAGILPLGTRMRLGGTAEFAGFDKQIRPERIDNLYSIFKTVYPGLAKQIGSVSDFRPWAGLRPMSAHGVPVIGPTAVPNLWINTGHGHLGWTMAAGSGELIADQICDRKPVIYPEPYLPVHHC